jgi:type IV pilus assembly protein PilZ
MNASEKVVPFKKYSVVVPKLFNLILNMNHAQQVRLFEKAEELFSKERRVYQRKSCRIPVRYATYDRIFSNYITNMSQNGIFIETQKPLFVGEEVILDFKLEGFNEPLKITGKVAHATRSGIGVEFKDVDPKLAEWMGLIIDQMEESIK